MTSPPASSTQTVDRLSRAAIFGMGFFSLSQIPMMTLLVPLWASEIGAGAFWIGMAIASRAILAMFLSIQAGAIMDRLGVARVTLLLATAAGLLTLLYPFFPDIGSLLILQAVVGFLHVCCWIGAQAMVGSMTGGDPGLMGRFTFLTTLGNFLGPLLAGTTWEYLGPSGAFTLVALWSFCLVLVTAATRHTWPPSVSLSVSDFAPRLSDYAAGINLLRVPLVACIIVISAALAGTYAMRHTFLAVYLDSIAFQGTEIGIIVGAVALSTSVTGLAVGKLSRLAPPHWLLLTGTILGTVVFCLCPFFKDFWSLLAIAGATGICSGIAFPLILSILSRGVGRDRQATSVGLRASINRSAALVVPIAMGAIVAATDITLGFVTMGTMIVVIVAIVGVLLVRVARRNPTLPVEERRNEPV